MSAKIIMYFVNKSDPICLNTVRELARHFTNPNKTMEGNINKIHGLY